MTENTPLAKILRERIAREGPMTFRDFMAEALHHPEHGYYARGPTIGPGGDFSTSARFPAFSRALARLVVRARSALGDPRDFRVVEAGAGTGDVARGILAALRDVGAEVAYVTVDASPALRAGQSQIEGVEAVARFEDLAPAPGILVANEVLDALPVHRVVGRDDGIVEQFVDVNPEDGFRLVEKAPSTPAVGARIAEAGIALAPGQVAEVCLEYGRFFRSAAAAVPKGYALVIDYGDDAADLYAPGKREGTLATYRAHGKGRDPFAAVGAQDLTADVDFTAATAAAQQAGFAPLLRSEQGALLWALGLADEAREAKARGDEALLKEIAFLVGPHALGSAFDALLFSRDAPALF